MDDRAYKSFEKEISKDIIEIERHKADYANQVKNGLGRKINDFNSYIKKEPSRWERFKNFVSKVFKHI
jgi:hypothetical protein